MSVCAIRHTLCVAIVLLMVPANQATAVIINGDFSDATDLFGWTATGAVVGEPTGAFGQLATDGTFIRTLEQTFVIPSGPSVLLFDFAFSTDTTMPPAGFPDSFAASLITTIDVDFLDILVVDIFGVLPDPSDGIEGITGATPIDVSYDDTVTIPGYTPFAGGTTFSGRISLNLPGSVLGEEATLFFDVFDELDGASTRAAVDNVSVIPEPASLVSWAFLSIVSLLGIVWHNVARAPVWSKKSADVQSGPTIEVAGDALTSTSVEVAAAKSSQMSSADRLFARI